MDYEKKYKEALERAKKIHKVDFVDAPHRQIAETIFPELKESEDELIRKRLINLIKELAANKEAIHTGGYFVDGQDKKYIAYLEKQKEQKLTNDILESSFRMQECLFESSKPLKIKQNKPAEWSEEDEERLKSIIHRIGVICGFSPFGEIKRDLDWLKSLRPQPHWKPSEEQMEALRIAYEIGTANESWAMSVLKSLYEQLKSL